MKVKLVSIGLLFLLLACSRSQHESNEQIVKQMFEYFNQHDLEKMAGLYSQEAEFLDPAFGTEYVKQSHQQIIEKYSSMEQLFPNIHDEVVSICSSDDKVIVQFISTGNSGDSIQFRLPIAAILTLQNGKIVRDATYYDN